MLTDERIDELVRIKCPALFKSNILYLEAFHAIEAEVLQAQEPVAEVVKFGISRTMAGLFMPVGTKLYAAQQPPAPCPKCNSYSCMSWSGNNVYGDASSINTVKEAVHYAGQVTEFKDIMQAQPQAPCKKCESIPFNLEATELHELRKDNKYLQATIAQYEIDFALEHDDKVALQAKVAEHSQKYVNLQLTQEGHVANLKATIAEQSAEIERLTKLLTCYKTAWSCGDLAQKLSAQRDDA